MSTIADQVRILEKERRDYSAKVMNEYDKVYYAKMRELQSKCDHNFKFSHFGPLWHSWSYCTYCRKSKVEDPD